MSTTPPIDALSLVGRQKAEFNYAASVRTWIVRTQVGIGIIGAVSVFVSQDSATYVVSLLGIVLAGIWLLLTIRHAKCRGHAERLRRTTLIAGGLGVTVAGDEAFELSTMGCASDQEAARLVDPNYFATAQPAGTARLREMVRESAIWTATLARIASGETWLLFGGLAVVGLGLLLSSILFLTLGKWVLLARVIFAFLVVVFSVDLLGAAIAYGDASIGARRIIDRLERTPKGSGELEQLMIVVSDYNSVVEAMPLFPRGLYGRHQKRLNEQYKLYLTGQQ